MNIVRIFVLPVAGLVTGVMVAYLGAMALVEKKPRYFLTIVLFPLIVIISGWIYVTMKSAQLSVSCAAALGCYLGMAMGLRAKFEQHFRRKMGVVAPQESAANKEKE